MSLDIDKESILQKLLDTQDTGPSEQTESAPKKGRRVRKLAEEKCEHCGAPQSAWAVKDEETDDE